MVELEKAYDNFCIIDEEYETVVSNKEHAEHRIVNGQVLTTYRANVSEVYTGARNAFAQAKATKTPSVAQLGSVPSSTDSPTHLLDGSTTPPVQGTIQSETSADLDQIAPSSFTTPPQTGNVTVSANNVQASVCHAGVVPMNPTSYSQVTVLSAWQLWFASSKYWSQFGRGNRYSFKEKCHFSLKN